MTTPKNIIDLKSNQVFVFGSNLNGSHGGGAAKLAQDKFGAIDGQGEGIMGQSYAFPTLDENMKKVSKKALKKSKELLYKVAEDNKDKQFLVTKVGCGIAGFDELVMKEVFKGEKPENVILPAGWAIIKGFKAFKKGLICRDFQYELGKDFYFDGKISPCESGFHFCKNLSDVYLYYTFGDYIEVGEIESEGEVIDEENKSVTNHIRITRLLGKKEASNNVGRDNCGHSNTGDRNTGHWNTGDRNTGHRNTGDSNTGHWNTGDRNTGHWNTGDWNTGDRNTGHRNTGHWNTGHWNTGDWNTGDSNTGHWNTANYHTGAFNTKDCDIVYVFNKKCSREKWKNAEKPNCLYFNLTEWIYFENMTDEEKIKYPQASIQGGFLKKYGYKEAFTKSMQNASAEDIKLLKKLPNFNAKVFEKISGFKIN